MWDVVFEPVATCCNILSNVAILRVMCHDPRSPIPICALLLQVSANVSWVSFAALTGDWYLVTTASASLCLQVVSCALRSRRDVPRKPIRFDTSNDELPYVSCHPASIV